MNGARIVSTGMAVPEKELTNAELGARLDVNDSWIVDRSGIRTRRVASPRQNAASLGTVAALNALERAGMASTDVDSIICATVTSERRFPATACVIGAALGTQAPAYDVNAGCSGFLFALAQADAAVRSGSARCVLVVGTDVMSRITDPYDTKTAILFGDGAGAVVVGPSASSALGPFLLRSDGTRSHVLTLDENDHTRMEGREVFRLAVAAMSSSLSELLAREGRDAATVDLVIAHQANQRILSAVGERVGLRDEQVFSNISTYGNTSAGSIPIALHEAQEDGALREGDIVALTAFGAGFCWGAGLLQWSPAPVRAELTAIGVEHA